MRSAIDSGGRVVIPKAIRDRLGLGPGTVVDVAEHEGHIEMAPVEAPVELVEVNGALVARSTEKLPTLTNDIVRETLENTRG
jgi:AbrB family looped-hinge helix DNA binding protein